MTCSVYVFYVSTFAAFVPPIWPEKTVKFPLSHLTQIQHCRHAGSVDATSAALTYQNVNRAVFFTLLHRLFLVAEQEQARVCLFKPLLYVLSAEYTEKGKKEL